MHPPVGRLSWVSIPVLLLVLAVASAAAAEPLRIRYAVWVGYGPLFLAQQKGYFAAEKVEVQLVKMEDPKESFLRWTRAGSTESSLRSTP